MELLVSTRNADLLYALYGLLMFLPQCQAFHCLKDRLACIPPENVVKLNRYSNMSEILAPKYKQGKLIGQLLARDRICPISRFSYSAGKNRCKG